MQSGIELLGLRTVSKYMVPTSRGASLTFRRVPIAFGE